VLPVPFTVRPDNPDPRIRAALSDDPDARAAVLAWAIAGAVAWHRNGERDPEPPELVRRRKVEYLREQDPFAAWADDALEATGDSAFTPTTALAEHYRRWCEANGERRPHSTKALGAWLRDNAEDLGITAGRSPDRGRARGWTGLRLRDGGAA
jgi:phage/plasmid-associated DNA primase